jgi:PmbA protein
VRPEDLQSELQRRAGGDWELYRKSAESRELDASPELRRRAWRREEGWAARWWERGSQRFAAATSLRELLGALPEALAIPAAPEEPPDWPRATAASAAAPEVEEPADLFDPVARALASASRGEALLTQLSVRTGRVDERLWNGAGLDVAQTRTLTDGLATAGARRGSRANQSRLPFRWPEGPEIEALARRLADAATLPLADRASPFRSGQWLLDPSVAAALLAALAPSFCGRRPPRRGGAGKPASIPLRIADDAASDSPYDGEGVSSRRVVLYERGEWIGRLEDLRSAKRSGRKPTGHGVRSSFRTPPRAGPRRLLFEHDAASSSAALLGGVQRGLFAAALTAPVRVDAASDRYEIEFSGISLVGGRAQAEVGAARSSGRLSELLRRVSAAADDRRFFALPFLVGSPTLLVERASFE